MAAVPYSEEFEAAAGAFVRIIRSLEGDQWEQPGLGVWSVRELVGHTWRAITTVEHYLSFDAPAEVTVPDAEGYYVQVFDAFTDNDAVARRGVESAAGLGDDPAGAVETSLWQVSGLLASETADRIVGIGSIALPLGEYLRTRCFELVVHTLDLERATGHSADVPETVLADAAALAARVATAKGAGAGLLFALTGRGALPEGFTIF